MGWALTPPPTAAGLIDQYFIVGDPGGTPTRVYLSESQNEGTNLLELHQSIAEGRVCLEVRCLGHQDEDVPVLGSVHVASGKAAQAIAEGLGGSFRRNY